MANLIKKIKIKKQDGSFTDYIPIGADAANIETTDGESVQLKLNKKPYYYNSVADMKVDTKLKVGDMAITLGYHEANDNGGSKYLIRLKQNDEIPDEGGIIEIVNNLIAEMIVQDNTIDIRQLGYKPNTSTQDCHDSIQQYVNLCTIHNDKFKLFIPAGI